MKRMKAALLPLIILIMSLCVSCSVYRSGKAVQDVRSAFRQAELYYADRDYFHAAITSGKVIRNAGEENFAAYAMQVLGSCYDSMNMFQNAKEVYDSGFSRFSGGGRWNVFPERMLSVDLRISNFDSVCLKYRQYYEKNLDSHDAKRTYAKALCHLEKYDEALVEVNGIITRAGTDCKAGIIRAQIYFALQDTVRAESELIASLLGCPAATPGLYYQRAGFQSGVEKLRPLRKIYPPSEYYDLAVVTACRELIRIGNRQLTIAYAYWFSKDVPDSPFLSEMLLLKGYFNIISRKRNEADSVLEEAFNVLGASGENWVRDSIAVSDSLRILERAVNEYVAENEKKIQMVVLKGASDSILADMYLSNVIYLEKLKRLKRIRKRMWQFHTFSGRREEIQDQLEYAIAKPTPLPGERYKANVERQKTDEDKYNEEVEKLKKELEALAERAEKEGR